jgi:hypothetical protein
MSESAVPEHRRKIRFSPLQKCVGLSLAAIIIILVIGQWSWLVAGWVVYCIAFIAIFSGVLVLSRSKPLPPLSTTSALFARFGWLGRYLVAGGVLVGGILLAQALSGLRIGDAVSFAAESLLIWLLPLGLAIVAFLLVLDLGRIGTAQRVLLVRTDLTGGETPKPSRLADVVAEIIGHLSHPAFVSLWAVCSIAELATRTHLGAH